MKENKAEKKQNTDNVSKRSAAGRRQNRVKKMSTPMVVLVSVCAIIALAVLAFSITVPLLENKSVVSSGVHIEGYDVSGMTEEEVISYLSSVTNPYESLYVTIRTDDKKYNEQINAKDISLVVDKEKSAEAALLYGKGNAFKSLYAKLFKKDVGYKFSYDHLKLDTLLNDFARKVGGTLVQHEINISEEEITIRAGKEGLGIDVAALRKRVLDTIEKDGEKDIVVSKVNTTPASIDVDELFEMTRREAKDAKYVVENNEVVVEKEVDGRYIDTDSARTLLNGFAPGSADVSIPFIMEPASVKAEELSMALFSDTLGSYSTKYLTSNVPRSANVELAARFINGKILVPGEEFSYNGTVGKRTAERGFRAASVYENNKMVDGLGGGICQTSSTLYAAVLYADLEVTERHEHSLEVSYAPLGMDATVAYGSLDFKFKNNTNMPIKIVATAGRGTVSVKILGTNENPDKTVKITTQTLKTTPYGVTEIKDEKLPTGETVVDAPGFKGHVVNTYKIIYENGKEVENKLLHKSTYTMVNRVVRVGTGEPAAETVNPQDPQNPQEQEPQGPQEIIPTQSPLPTPTVPTQTARPTPPPMPDGL